MRGTTCISRPPSINTDWSLIFSFTDDDDNEEEEEKEKEEGEKEEEKEEDGGNREADQDGIRRAHSTSSVVEKGPIDQSQILIRGLSEKTCPDGLVNFIEARSGGKEVKDVQMLKNGKALVTMANEIKGTYLSIKSRE